MFYHALRMKLARSAWKPSSTRQKLRRETGRMLLITVGVFVAALGYVLFQIPFNIAAGGLGGIAIVVNHYTNFNIGLIFWVLNIPMLIVGYIYLGGWKFVGRTLVASTLFSIFTDLLGVYLPTVVDPFPVTDNLILSTIYGGIVGGLGGGLIYRAGSSIGGTGVLGRIVQKRTGMPLSQAYMMNDSLILVTMGIVFGWENALYGFMMLFLNGLSSDYALEGASSTRTATIVTNKPHEVIDSLFETLQKGSSYWEIKGGYTDQKRYMVMCTMYRSQMSDVKYAIAKVDSDAFVTIGVTHQALGQGFVPLKKKE